MKSEMALAAASAAAQNMPNKPLYGCQVINGVPPPQWDIRGEGVK